MIRKLQLAALVAVAFFLSTAAAAQKRDPSAWMHEIGPVAGIYGFFGAESGADAFYGLDYSHSYWNGLGFRTGFRYMLECCNVGDVVSVPLAFSWRSRLRTEPERLAGGVAGLSPYGFHDTPSAGTVLGAFLLNLFSRFEVYAGVTPGYVFGKSNVEKTAEKYGIKNFIQIPIDPKVAEYADKGLTETIETDYLQDFFKSIK